jgi:hypothetical protein
MEDPGWYIDFALHNLWITTVINKVPRIKLFGRGMGEDEDLMPTKYIVKYVHAPTCMSTFQQKFKN